MALLKIKVATYFMGGMLLCMSISGCSLSQPPDVLKSNQPPVEPTPDPTPTTLAEKLGVIAPTPTTAPAALLPLPTPLVAPMPIPTPKDGAYTYHTIGPGETLSYIALIYGVEIGDLVELNNLAGPSALIQVDQQLRVPVQTDRVAPDGLLLVDSEVVYSPAFQPGPVYQSEKWISGQLLSISG
jgi:LysM repeat protein